MSKCKNCGEELCYGIDYVFTKRKILSHMVKPYLLIGNFGLAPFNYQITDKCNKPELIEEIKGVVNSGQ